MTFTKEQMIAFLEQSTDEKLAHVAHINKDWKLREDYEKNIYKHPLFMLIQVENNHDAYAEGRATKKATFYRCKEHTNYWNIHLAMIVDHMFEERHLEKHKEFIINQFSEHIDEPKPKSEPIKPKRKRYFP